MRDVLSALTNLGSGIPGTLSTESTTGTESTSGTSGTVRTVRTVRTEDLVPVRTATAVWWERHQLIVALAYWFMVWPTWRVHGWAGQYGVLTFLAVIAVVVIGANTRLHLWFSARNYPEQLAARPSVIRMLVRVADIAFSVQMIAIGLTIANDHTGWAALFVSFGLGALLACLVIEPATERAAFGSTPQ